MHHLHYFSTTKRILIVAILIIILDSSFFRYTDNDTNTDYDHDDNNTIAIQLCRRQVLAEDLLLRPSSLPIL